MFHLNARVHFNEVEAFIFIHQELDGAGVLISDLTQGVLQLFANLFTQLWRNAGGRRFFQQLLMPALNAAFAFAECHYLAVLVGENLKLDVARSLDKFFHVQIAITESCRSLRMRRLIKLRQLFCSADHTHAAPTAPSRGLQDHGIAHLFRRFESIVFALDHPF